MLPRRSGSIATTIGLICLAVALLVRTDVSAGEVYSNRWPAKRGYANPAITRAMEAVREAKARLEKDPSRPVFHFRPPAQWMNDPNGAIFHKGYYHVFYQLNPNGDQWGVNNTVWAHTRSRDLVHWEHLPIAIPAPRGVKRINSGCTEINGAGRPMAFFPAVFEGNRPREIWAAISDDDMIEWQFHPANPIMTFETHGGPRYKKWDAPFIFHDGGRTFMILSSCYLADGRFVIPIYETSDPELVRWEYRGLLHELERGSDSPYLECPMIFRDGQRWAIIGVPAPAGPACYFTGAFDIEALRFTTQGEGSFLHGAGPLGKLPDGATDRGLAPTSIYQEPGGRCLMFGWQSSFPAGRGWAGCMGLPRVLTIDPDGRPRQAPVEELRTLRGEHFGIQKLTLNDSARVIAGAEGDTLEILAEFEPEGAKAFGLKVRRSTDGSRAVVLRCDGRTVDVAGTTVPLEPGKSDDLLALHLFLDKSLMEVFVNDGRHSVTRVVSSDPHDLGIELFAEGGAAVVKSLDIWRLKSIWSD